MRRIRWFGGLFMSATLVFAGFVPLSRPAEAAGVSFIRDTEIENTIRVYTAPLFKAAGLDIASVDIYLVKDKRLNAFVAGGQKLFIHTGLLQRAEGPGQVIGVLAHELGHIAGGHLARLQDGLSKATAQSIVAMMLGGAAAMASGSGDALAATLAGSQHIGQRTILQYTRSMEQAADQAGIGYLEATHQSARGLLQFLEILADQEAILSSNQDPYISTHPVTQDRIEFVRHHVEISKYSDVEPSAELKRMHARMRGKLNGFLDPPANTLQHYDASDPSIEARYARAIAYMQLHEVDNALAIVDSLLEKSPDDPFFHELKGDILRDAGRVRESISSYEAAIHLLPWAALIRMSLATSQLGLEEPAMTKAALANLQQALRYEREIPGLWHMLATAQGRLGNRGEASLALAEEALLRGKTDLALRHAGSAARELPTGSPSWLRTQDIENAAKAKK